MLNKKQNASSDKIQINPAKTYLIFFNGTDEKNRQFIQSKSAEFQKKGIKFKLLAFIQSKGDLQNFGMALYNESNIRWNYLPKENLVELVQSQEFDMLININPEELKHQHYLAVAANAKFKVSTFTDLSNNFNLTVKTNPNNSFSQSYKQIEECLKTLSI